MKKIISKYIKLIFGTVLISLFGLCLFLLYKEEASTAYTEQKQVSSVSKASLSYSVGLKPNSIYSNKWVSEDNVYISSYVDSINTLFNYEFQGKNDTIIKGSYKAVAIMEGYSKDEGNGKPIWQKEFGLLPTLNIDAYGGAFSISKEIPVNFEEYNNFANKVMEESKIVTPARLTVAMIIDFKAEDANGEIIEKIISPSIVVPLNVPYFEITKQGVDEKPEVIESAAEAPPKASKYSIIIAAIAVLILISILVYVSIVYISSIKSNTYEKRLNKIFKEHGSRIAALSGEVNSEYKNIYTVKSIEDLIKIADELSRPILYGHSSDNSRADTFYIVDSEEIYGYDLIKDIGLNEKAEEKVIKRKIIPYSFNKEQ